MKKALRLTVVGYILVSIPIILYLEYTRRTTYPPPDPLHYFHDDRKQELLEIADYMREHNIKRVFRGSSLGNATLQEMIQSNQLDKVEFVKHGVVVFGVLSRGMWYEYHHGENVFDHINDLMTRFPQWTYFRLEDDWYFVTTRKRE